MGRSQKSIRNVLTGLLNKAALMIPAFITKTVFIRLLGAEYNGVNSLYGNILSVLALAELGLGNVLMFYLYPALKNGNEKEICLLTQEFKRIYNIIIIAVLSIGLAIVPFLRYIVNSDLNYNELVVYYLLYLANSVASYFVVYRTMVLRADQREYIINNVSTVTTVVMYALQLLYLFLYRNFLGYLIIQVGCTISSNIIQNYITLKRYPFLKWTTRKDNTLIDRKEVFRNVKATFLFKISDTILDQTDNIIISVMFGTIVVGYYANYYMVIFYLVAIASIIVSGLVASYGNLYVEHNNEKSYKMLRCAMFIFSIYGAFCVACYMSVIQDFISIWVGNQYLMKYDLVAGISMVFYLRMVTNTIWIYRSTMGLFKEVQYINLIAAVLNIVFSIVLGIIFGITGVIIATAISRLLTSFWYEGKIVFGKLNKPVKYYYLAQLKDLVTTLVIVLSSFSINIMIEITGFMGIIIKVIICAIITVSVEVIINGRTDEFRTICNKIILGIKK